MNIIQHDGSTADGMHHDSEAIEEKDTRAIIRMLTEAYAIEGGHANKKRHLLDALSAYISADKWLAALRVQSSATDAPKFVGLLHSGFTSDQLARITEAAAHPCAQAIEAPFAEELIRRKTHITLRLEDFDQQRRFPGSPAEALSAQAGVGTLLASTRPIYDTESESIKSSAIALYRVPGASPFSVRERRIAHILLSEVDWLHTEGWPSEHLVEVTSELPRSHMPMLSLLVHGNSREEIAQLTQLSIHTVNSYVKETFRHFGVNSQIELMKLFIYGDGNDQMRRPSSTQEPAPRPANE